jgi:hypothetical protein
MSNEMRRRICERSWNFSYLAQLNLAAAVQPFSTNLYFLARHLKEADRKWFWESDGRISTVTQKRLS